MRRQILADIGIDVWRVRVGPAAVHADAARAHIHAPSEPAAAAAAQGPRTERRSVSAPTAAPEPRAEPPAGAAEPAPRNVKPAAPAGAAVAPFSVLAVSVGGVTLLMEGERDRRTTRLVRDLLAAATGQWMAEPFTRQFDWPLAVGLPELSGRDVADRALLAFVDKTLADHASWLVMVVGAVERRLPALTSAVTRLALPDLKTLGQDPAAKRELWAAIERLRPQARQKDSGTPVAPPGAPSS